MFSKDIFSLCLFSVVIAVVNCNRTIIDEDLRIFLGALERYANTPNDVVFLLDESGSIEIARFPYVKEFTKLTVQRFSVSADHSRIAVVTFATETIAHVDYLKNPGGNNMCTLLQKIDNIGYVGEWTHTDKAMREAERIFENSRPNSNKIIVLLTDGQSNDGHSPVAIAQELKARGIIIFAVGVAEVNVAEINAVASSPDHIYILKNFDYIKQVNVYLVNDTRDTSMDLVKDASQCNSFCTGGVDCCDEHANCYCGSRSGRYECACIAGYYGRGMKGECHKCPKGTYKSIALNSNCTLCPEHSTTLKEGSTSFTDCFCENGYEKNGNFCTAVKCAILSAPEGGILIPSHCNNTYGTQCSFKCRAGYCPFSCKDSNHLPQVAGHHIPLPTRTCLETRAWTGEEFYCEKVTCPALQFPFDGNHNCSEKDFTYGTTCNFTCNKGYELDGSVKRTCLLNGSWTGKEARCEKIHCSPLKTNLNLRVKPTDCGVRKMPYRSVCQYFCAKGYTMQSDSNDTAGIFQCEANQKWSGAYNKISCRDITPPKIVCPKSIIINAEFHKGYAQVFWDLPVATDNLNTTKPTTHIISPKGLRKPPYKFNIGVTKVVYRATDISDLFSDCSFTVTVLDKEPPKLIFCPSDIEVYHDKNTGIPVTWEEPAFEDNSKKELTVTTNRKSGDSFAWGSEFRVQYTASDESGNSASCNFTVKVKHYPCPYYPAPANGLMTCDTWSDGRLCSIFCHDGFEFASGAKSPSLYFCRELKLGGKSQGIWQSLKGQKQKMPWPDCSRMQKPKSINVTMGVSYSVDSCSEEVLQKMRKKFIDDLKALGPASKMFCPKECVPEKVNIVCKPTRIRRSIIYSSDHISTYSNSNMKSRRYRDAGGQTLTISFSMEMFSNVTDLTSGSKLLNGVDAANEVELSSNTFLKQLEKNISESVKDAYHLTSMPEPKREYYVIAKCSSGQIKVNNSCVNCPAGNYKDEISEKCIVCPQATYQDEERQLSCKPCPVGYTTHVVQSKSKEDCKAPCQPGTYSETTFEPCLACPLNKYQERAGRKDCMKCPSGLYTWSVGSNSSKDCVAPCKPGSYSDTGYEPCAQCDIHSYQDKEQQISCNRCPNRTSASGKGSTSAEDCKEIDVCKDLDPCQSGSTCIQEDKDYKCVCPEGLMGVHCEINPDDCDSNPCLNNGTCSDGIANFSCSCLEGWTGHQCETNIDDCDPNPCRNGGECVDMLNSYTCLCKPGFIGDNCEENVYECGSSPCLNNGTCFDKENGYRCCCSKGYYGQNCEKEFDICDTITCENGGTCFSSYDGFKCSCPLGFEGTLCEENIDECNGFVCNNGGVCLDGIGNATCTCPQQFVGKYCEEALPPEFMLGFPSPPSTSNYVELKNNHLLYAITVAFFMRTSFKDSNRRATPVSYSYKDKNHVVDNALTLLDTNNFVLYIHGEIFHTEYKANRDSSWHHYAVTWEKNGGKWTFYVDGNSIASGVHVGEKKYMHPGIFILGQEQDALGDSFSSLEAFAGDITEFNVWDYALPREDIKKIASSCGFVGNVIPWYVASKSAHGSVTFSSQVDKCKDVGTCSEGSCDCFYSNQRKVNSCKYDINVCKQGTCAHDQPCVTDEQHSYCNCSSGFEGRTCEYDIDECLENNGGCEYFCLNDISSYHCECPDDMILSEDKKSCKDTSFCLMNEEVYPDGETWMSSCKDCICDHGNVRCEEKICNQTACRPDETLITLPGECCPMCVAWSFCLISPNKTVMTFDLSSYEIEGDCTYTAVEDCIEGRFKVDFQKVQNGTGEMNLVIYQGCTVIVMTFDGRIFVDDIEINLPFKNNEIAVEEDKSILTVWTHSNLLIQWNFTDEIIIGVPITDENNVCGLCKHEKYYTYDIQKYPLPDRVATGEKKCFAIFEDSEFKSEASSIYIMAWSSTKLLYLFVMCVLTLHYYDFRIS